jgi:hypothetical protein
MKAPQFRAPVEDVPAADPENPIRQVAAAAARQSAALLTQDEGHEQATDGFKAEGVGHHRKFGWLALTEMVIDERVQRPEVPTEVNKIAREFNKDALGTATISARVDPDTGVETYVVLDGQQRRAGALKAGFTGKIRVDVHYNLTLADEARLFRILNERRPVQPIQLFKTALIEEDPSALAVQRILDELGIQFGNPRGYSGAKSSVRLVARRNGPTILRWALAQVQAIYDGEGKGGCYDAAVVEAFYWLYDHHGTRIDEENLYAKLSREKGGVGDLVGHAKTIKSVRGGKIGVNLIRAIIARYNADKRSARTRLPDWTLDASDQATTPVEGAE